MQNIGLTTTQRIDQALIDKHIQKKQLAEKIGVPATTLNSWINRSGDFPASYVVPVAQALEVNPLWLLTGEDHLPPKIPETYVELKEDERFLLETYRSLDREGRVVVSSKAVEELRRAKAEQGNAVAATSTTA